MIVGALPGPPPTICGAVLLNDLKPGVRCGGWTDPEASRSHIGALLLGYYTDDGRLLYAGVLAPE